jgi:putative AlgH/UPF0301 family transcriptional regulator
MDDRKIKDARRFCAHQLTHHFLIAMPGLEDESFAQRGLPVRAQRARRAGLIINKPTDISSRACCEKSIFRWGAR